MTNVDVENVVLAFTPGFSIKGRIDLDGAPLSTLPEVQRTEVFLAPIEPMLSSVSPQQIKADGTFTLENVQPGDYRVNIFGMPPNAYIESARLGRTDVLSGVSISGPVSESLEIVLSTKGGQIDGIIVDNEQKPMRGVQAILIPDRQRDRVPSAGITMVTALASLLTGRPVKSAWPIACVVVGPMRNRM